MAAITTTILAFARPGDVILHSQPLYGGTETLLANTLANFGIGAVGFIDGVDEAAIRAAAQAARGKGRVSIILIETPANPTNTLVDIALLRRIADEIGAAQGFRPVLVCDNTLLGPGVPASADARRRRLALFADQVCRRPLRPDRRRRARHEGDHARRSRRCAAASAPSSTRIPAGCWAARSRRWRSAWSGPTPTPGSSPNILRDHPKVEQGPLSRVPASPARRQQAIYARQCTGAGSTFSFDIKGGQKEAFAFLNALQVFKLAVSLGGTESLASHPAAMTHSGVPAAVRDRIGVLDTTIRMSVGIEHPDDLVADLTQALASA